MDVREAFRVADEHVDDAELDALFTELLRVPSEHTELMEADPAVTGFIADVVAPRLEALTGVAPRTDGMGNLLWQLDGAAADPAEGLLFVGYAMTYPASTMPEPFSGKVVPGEPYGLEGPCVWGRGGCEQKAALAAMLAAAGAVRRSDRELARPLSLAVSTAGETGRHDAARHMLEHDGLAARYGIVGLGTTNRVCLGNKGRIDVDVVVRGKSCHSSTPPISRLGPGSTRWMAPARCWSVSTAWWTVSPIRNWARRASWPPISRAAQTSCTPSRTTAG